MRPVVVLGVDDEGRSNGTLTMIRLENLRLHSALDSEPKAVPNCQIEPAVHDSETIRRTQHAVRVEGEIVALSRGNTIEPIEHLVPSRDELTGAVDQDDLLWELQPLHGLIFEPAR